MGRVGEIKDAQVSSFKHCRYGYARKWSTAFRYFHILWGKETLVRLADVENCTRIYVNCLI
jgi:hypothetical protein